MKWIYGKHDWKTLERGEENCYLMTNGLGGFSSMTMTGAVSRNDHALLMACVQAPNHRYNMVHRVKEEVLFMEGERTLRRAVSGRVISSQEFSDGHREEVYRFLSAFTYEDTPVWKYQVESVKILKEAGLKPGANTAVLRYEIENRGKEHCMLCITPFYQFVPKGSDMDAGQIIETKQIPGKGREQLISGSHLYHRESLKSGNLTLFVRTNGKIADLAETCETYAYRYDACDGRRGEGTAKGVHQILCSVGPGEKKTLEVIFEMELSEETAADVIEDVKNFRREWSKRAGFSSEMGKTLAKSASQFISKRESTGGLTILAGFPFFEDWGRDTMIALPGLCISTGQFGTAKQILRTFALSERNGLMPNLFPEGGSEPLYNTVDAALLFINCVYLYYEASSDLDFVKEVFPVMERIIKGYRKGTEFGICMDEDGLIRAGEGLAQVTWMDVRVGDVLPTPRHGKPVEINAYWYNALCIMEKFSALITTPVHEDLEYSSAEYARLAGRVKESFTEKFWSEKNQCLKDVLSGTYADEQVRCNQIWAVSMPFTMLNREKEKQIVETVFKKLYTPYGLRTLEEGDKEFRPFYGGPMEERDMAYHQGTVWTFPLGGYYLAYLKVHDDSEEAKQTVRDELEVMESAMREGCIAQLPEIYDGLNPTASKGCFAQAWSVGEILRVYEKIEK